MYKTETLRALVNDRLAAAAEDIFLLLERTIAGYEEELCRSREENQRKQQLLDTVLYPSVQLVRGIYQIPPSPDPALNQEIPDTSWIKGEPDDQSIKEEELLAGCVPEFSAFYEKIDESLLLQQRQTELREETQEEEPRVQSETHVDWRSPLSYSATQLGTEVDRDHYVQVSDRSSTLSQPAPETPVHNEDMTKAARAGRKKHQCRFCFKRFGNVKGLKVHLNVHSKKKLYSCSICKKSFAKKFSLESHKIIHKIEKIYSCEICNGIFSEPRSLRRHQRVHTGEKPYSCSLCDKTFSYNNNLKIHFRTHTGEKPHRCEFCHKCFSVQSDLKRHERTHTGEKPYRCSTCGKTFTLNGNLRTHSRTHTGEKPYSCDTCGKRFAYKLSLKSHMRKHTGEKNIQLFNGSKTFC